MTAITDTDRPAVAEVRAGDLITVSGEQLPFVAIVRCITTRPRGRVLHFEMPGLPACTWSVDYTDTERVERHAAAGQAA